FSRWPEALMLGASLVFVAFLAVLAWRNSQAAARAETERHNTGEIFDVNALVLSELKDAETGQRGFLLTGEERYLEPYRTSVAMLPEVLDRFRRATAAIPDQKERENRIEQLTAQKLDELKSTIDLGRARRQADAMAIVRTDRGKILMDEIRDLSLRIEHE